MYKLEIGVQTDATHSNNYPKIHFNSFNISNSRGAKGVEILYEL